MTKAKQEIEKPVWLKYTEEEVKAIIHKLAGQGLSAEKIGLILRDQYGIPRAKLYGLKIEKVVKEKQETEEASILNLRKKLDEVINHYKKNKQDKNAERSLIITKSKLKKREEYEEKKTKDRVKL